MEPSQTPENLKEEIHHLEKKLEAMKKELPPSSSKKNSGGKSFLIIVAFIGIVWIASDWFFSSQIKGDVTIRGAEKYTFEECRAGTSFIPQFFGVVLKAHDYFPKLEIQGADSASGMAWLTLPKDPKPILLNEKTCQTFNLKNEISGLRINYERSINGSFHAVCQLAPDFEVTVNANYKYCH